MIWRADTAECPVCHDTYHDLPGHLASGVKACGAVEALAEKSADLHASQQAMPDDGPLDEHRRIVRDAYYLGYNAGMSVQSPLTWQRRYNTLREAYDKNRRALASVEDIVRALAASDAPLDGEYGDCVICHGNRELIAARHGIMNDFPFDEPEGHDPSCPWRLAREWKEGPCGTG